MSGAATASTSIVRTVSRRIGGALKTSFAAAGVVAVGAGCYEYNQLQQLQQNADDKAKGDKKKNRVLVIPFHRLQLVERKDSSIKTKLLERLDSADTSTKPIPFEVRELVDLLHAAAEDPSISTLYGIFGHGSTLHTTGWAHLEEIRNAIRVVQESHRRHNNPNVQFASQLVIPVPASKQTYAYTDTFASFADPSNKEYYLASVFSDIHLQERGELNLFGLQSTQFFLKDILQKYGIQTHVFKHGKYKNFPNMLTNRNMNRYHLENVTNIQDFLNEDVCRDITTSRSSALLTSWLSSSGSGGSKGSNSSSDNAALWKRIQDSGTFPAETAWKAGLVDHLPRRCPLTDLVQYSTSKSTTTTAATTTPAAATALVTAAENSDNKKVAAASVAETWKLEETDFKKFKADSSVSLMEYRREIKAAEKAGKRLAEWKKRASFLAPILGPLGLLKADKDTTLREDTEGKSPNKIALLQVDGAIGDETANKLLHSIRKIRDDETTKCIVLRINSPGGSIVPCETISQELASLDIPVVVSFGNVAASGGYYIAAASDYIFASRKTITGSIGVFGIRLDLTGLLKHYNIHVDTTSTSDLAGSFQPFHTMSRKMKENFARQIDRHYAQFKDVVTNGRDNIEDIESIAAGRVFTGDQAKTIGLVDELGGLHRALAFAKRKYLNNEDDTIVQVWPKEETLFEKLMSAKKGGLTVAMVSMLTDDAASDAQSSSLPTIPATSGMYYCYDEQTALQLMLNRKNESCSDEDWMQQVVKAWGRL